LPEPRLLPFTKAFVPVVDIPGGRVVVTYNNAYDFAEADGHHFSGSARSGLWLEKSGNRWLITSEKDL